MISRALPVIVATELASKVPLPLREAKVVKSDAETVPVSLNVIASLPRFVIPAAW